MIITAKEIKEKVDFTILTPKKIPDDWTLDTKTSSWIMLPYIPLVAEEIYSSLVVFRQIFVCFLNLELSETNKPFN